MEVVVAWPIDKIKPPAPRNRNIRRRWMFFHFHTTTTPPRFSYQNKNISKSQIAFHFFASSSPDLDNTKSYCFARSPTNLLSPSQTSWIRSTSPSNGLSSFLLVSFCANLSQLPNFPHLHQPCQPKTMQNSPKRHVARAQPSRSLKESQSASAIPQNTALATSFSPFFPFSLPLPPLL